MLAMPTTTAMPTDDPAVGGRIAIGRPIATANSIHA